MSNGENSSFIFAKSIRVAFCVERDYYISELTPNPDMMQPPMLIVAKLIHDFNSLMNMGITVEQYEQEMDNLRHQNTADGIRQRQSRNKE